MRVPQWVVSKLCSALRAVLDRGLADSVVFAFRPLFWTAGLLLRSRPFFVPIVFAPGACHDVCGGDPRIAAVRWAEQRALLFGGPVVAFVTHGGYSSLAEALSAAVPVAVLPVFGDQPGACEQQLWFCLFLTKGGQKTETGRRPAALDAHWTSMAARSRWLMR